MFEKVVCYGHLLSLRVDVEDKLEQTRENISEERVQTLEKTIDSLNHIMYVMDQLFHRAEMVNIESSKTHRASLELTVENSRLKGENDLMREQIREWML
jgi:hypothetical protein|tara:strand:+ start:987 stop:1283 length:297 start_codon:yes stop_codon:yes gene_type:complete